MTAGRDHPPGEVRPPLTLGDVRVRFLCGGRLSLDGGAMFGIVPRTLWERVAKPDEAHRVALGTCCLLVETGGRRIVVETGIGDKYDERDRRIYALSDHWLADSLAAVGVDPAEIDLVVLTHLHFDHAGGATRRGAAGRAAPTFPRAAYVVPRGEWDDARTGHYVMSGTYREENLAPLEASGRLSLVSGEAEIAPGVRVLPLPGHTRHQQGVRVHGGGRTLLHLADLMPTSAHVGLRYNMAYDLLPYENMRTKERMLSEAVAGGWTLLCGQDAAWPTWRAQGGAKGIELHREQ